MVLKLLPVGLLPVVATAGALDALGAYEWLLVLFTVAPVALFGLAAWTRLRGDAHA